MYHWLMLSLLFEAKRGAPNFKGQAVQKELFSACLTLEDGTERLCRNVDKYNLRFATFQKGEDLITPRRKPEIK